MKLSTQAFPYPVLSPREDNDTDYKDSSFQCKLNFASEISDNGKFAVEYSCLIINAEIEKFVSIDTTIDTPEESLNKILTKIK